MCVFTMSRNDVINWFVYSFKKWHASDALRKASLNSAEPYLWGLSLDVLLCPFFIWCNPHITHDDKSATHNAHTWKRSGGQINLIIGANVLPWISHCWTHWLWIFWRCFRWSNSGTTKTLISAGPWWYIGFDWRWI